MKNETVNQDIFADSAESTSTVFTELYKIVRPFLRHYETDLIKHDRTILESYTGPFIYGYRWGGTNLVKLLPDMKSYEDEGLKVGEKYLFGFIENERNKIEILKGQKVWVTQPGHNTEFLYFDGRKLMKRDREQLIEIYDRHINQVIEAAKPHIDLYNKTSHQLITNCSAW